ncbi:MAG TPA: nucleoside-diphosphate sugar epimerase/dehydratase [Kofleriaceae bacterium]|nr:nucleoside-diphosphate sugar epimerase/dehydratase [Kofleriaceae bacterium]
MSRHITRGLQVAIDLSVLFSAFALAFLFRFEFAIPRTYMDVALHASAWVVASEYLVLVAFSVPQYTWRYIGMREMLRIGLAVAAASLVLFGVRIGFAHASAVPVGEVPLGVLAMNAILGFVGIVGVRATRRVQAEAVERGKRTSGSARDRVLLIGAGQAGVMVARELQARPDLGLDAVGFLDDDRIKVGSRIGGLPVLGTTDQVAAIAERKRVKRVLITIANAPGSQIRRIALSCNDAGLETKIIPGIYEIVGDRVNLSRIRDVAIDDLLGREPVQLDEAIVGGSIRGHVVLVTGAGGSIGSELCRQVARFAPRLLILVERFENALFEIHRELLASYPGLAIEPRVADVCDCTRMETIFRANAPHVVFHAAAHKHVPMMEHNPGEALKNNVGGTQTMAQLADRYHAGQFVLVSTDKAVNPSSVMGATKRLGEILCQAFAARSKTRFVTVRFGNVLGSNGSVIPIFREQIAKGGPVTVTHPEMSRYFMTIPEAAQLVLQAGAMGQGGEILILDMGKPIKIVDLATDLIELSGLKPHEDIKIVFSGVRPGEKLHEELSTSIENADKTKHPKIYIGRIAPHAWDEVASKAQGLLAGADSLEPDALRASLRAIVPEYTPKAAEPAAPPARVAEPRTVERPGSLDTPELANVS